MKILVDVNLPPEWIVVLERHGFEAVHWTQVGDPRASDAVIMQWARDHRFVVFTHDLGFGPLLALTSADGPSVLQIRTQDVLPSALESIVVAVLQEHRLPIETGAIISVDRIASRIRILPIRR